MAISFAGYSDWFCDRRLDWLLYVSSVIGDRITNNPSPSLVNKPEILATVKATPKLQSIPPESYIVQSGDSLEYLAQKLCGNGEKWRDFVVVNSSLIGKEGNLEIGEKLNIPQNCKGE